VFVDANVLYSVTLRNWLFMLRNETVGMFQLHTTEDVMAEAFYRLRRDKPDLPGGVISDLRDKLEKNLDEILRDFDTTVPYGGTDPNDLHVHAAAIAGGAHILLTQDQGFASSEETQYEVFNCDDFFLLLDDSSPRSVQRVTHAQRAYWAGKPGSAPKKTLVQALMDAGCPQFAYRVNEHLRTLSGPIPGDRRRGH